MTDNVYICKSNIEILETIRKVEISSLQKLIRYWKILIFADILLIIWNVGVVYYKIVFNWNVMLAAFMVQFLIMSTGIMYIILLKREIRKLMRNGCQ